MKSFHRAVRSFRHRSPRLGATVAVAAALLLSPLSAFAQEEGGLLENLGDLFGGFGGNGKAADAPVLFDAIDVNVIEVNDLLFNAVPAGPGVDPAKLKVREKRMTAWCENWQHWLHETVELTEDQQARISKLLENSRKREELTWKRNEQQQQRQTNLPDTCVVLFAGRTGPLRKVMDSGPSRNRPSRELARILTPEQFAAYTETDEARTARQHDLIALRATAVLDAELYFNPDLRAETYENVRKRIRSRSNGLFAFHNQRYYLPYETVGTLVTVSDEKSWHDAQQKRWSDLRSSANNQNQVYFQGGESTEQWQERLNAIQAMHQRKLINAAAVRSQYLATTLDLAPEEARHLEVAGKGSTVRCLRKWKADSQKQLDEMAVRAAQQNFAFGISGLPVNKLDDERLWKKTVASLSESTDRSPVSDHANYQREGAIAFVLLTLDRELLLSEEQLDGMKAIIAKTGLEKVPTEQNYMQELALVGRAVLRADSDSVRELLNDTQESVWKDIQRQMRPSGRTGLIISTQHGDTHLQIGN